jgi:hypothetical protein
VEDKLMSFGPFTFGRHKLWNVGWATYFTLRTSLMVLAFAMPLVLWLGGELFGDLALEGSISAYYHAGVGETRDIFVGSIVAVAALLMVYKGFTGFENWALNIGGGALVLVALVPDDHSTSLSESLPWLHVTSAITFFVCLVYVAWFRAGDTLGLIPEATERARFRQVYRIIGGGMVVSVGLAVLLSRLTDAGGIVFFVETAGVWSFAVFWFFKTREMKSSGADALANRQLLRRPRYSLRDLFRPIPIEVLQADGGGESQP